MFRLLCPDGTQAPVSRYRSCNLGRGPGGAVVTRYNFRKVSRKFLLAVQVFFFSYCGFCPQMPSLSSCCLSNCFPSVVVWSTWKGKAAFPALQLRRLWRERPSLQRFDPQTGCCAGRHGCQPSAGAGLCSAP